MQDFGTGRRSELRAVRDLQGRVCLPPDWPYAPASPVQLATVLVPADALDRMTQDGALEHRRPVQVYRLLGRVHPRLEGASHHQVHLKREERKTVALGAGFD